ncbi:MAG: ABC transporter ATP-binding protein, partial [Pseudomonadota bacterium]
MERTLLGFVWAHAKREQSFIIMLSLASFPITLAALYIPKLIVNDVLQNESFPIQAVGYEFGQIGYLAALCTVLFTLIAANSALRYVINMLCGLSGERLLRRLRYTIYDRTTRMPLPRLKAISVGEIVQAVTAEVEEIGAFCYEIIIKPVYQGGQLLVYLGFILFQDPILGLAAIILFPIQAFVVPTIQRIIVDLVQQRIRKIREISVQIADAIEGVDAMHLNDARLWHLAGVSNNLYDSFRLRFLIFRLRFSVKFANDVINQITPFVFYAIGGYLVIEGRMDLGALIAIIAAYKDVAAPWRDLLIYYQDFTDNSAQYEALYAKYGRDRLPDEETARSEPPRLAGRRISLSNLRPAGRERGLTAELRPGETTLVVGPADRGRTALLRTLAGLEPAEAGALRIDGSEAPLSALLEARGQLAMVTRAAAALPGTFRDNVAYGLYRAPRGGGETAEELLRAREAEKTGAIDAPRDADWIDYARAGVAGAAAFDARALDVLRALELEEELYSRGLWSRAQVGAEAGAATALAEAARAARVRLGEKGRIEALSEMVEFWDFERFHDNATLAENLFFGVPDAGFGDLEAFVRAPETQEALRTARIGAELAKIGLEAAETLRD